MKNLTAILLAVMLSMSLISCGTNPASTMPDVITVSNNSFDAEVAGNTGASWHRATIFESSDALYYPVSADEYVSPGQSLKIHSLKKDYDRQIIKQRLHDTFPDTEGVITVNFNVYISFLMSGRAFVFYLDQKEKMRLDFNFGGGISYYSAGNTNHTSSFTWTAGEWYNVTMTYDIAADTYSWTTLKDGVINGLAGISCNDLSEQKLDGTLITPAQAVYTTFFGVLTNMDLSFTDYTMYLDDVKVTYSK